jgi:hypothetical protein
MVMTHRGTTDALDDVQLASPCTADWDHMVGDERVRFCGTCKKNVYNLSALPRDQAEGLLRGPGDELCIRFYRRADGTLMTADCPVGVSRKRRLKVLFGAVGGTMLVAAAVAGIREGGEGRRPGSLPMESPQILVGGIAPASPDAPVTPTSTPAPVAPSTPVQTPRPPGHGKPHLFMGTAPIVRGV